MAKELFIPKGTAFLLDKKVENVAGTPYFSMKKWLKRALSILNIQFNDDCCPPSDPRSYTSSVRVSVQDGTPTFQYYDVVSKEWRDIN